MPSSREPSSWASLLRRHPRVVVAVVLLAVLAVVIGAMGGWARTSPEGLRVAQPGELVEATPFRISLTGAEATYEESGRAADEGRAYLAIEGTLALDHHEAVTDSIVTDAVVAGLRAYQFGKLSDAAAPSVRVAQDGSSLVGLGPGLTYDVRLVYEIDEAAVPATVTVSLLEHLRRASSLDVSTTGWHDAAPVARVVLDIAPLPDERPVEDFL